MGVCACRPRGHFIDIYSIVYIVKCVIVKYGINYAVKIAAENKNTYEKSGMYACALKFESKQASEQTIMNVHEE